MAFTGYSQSHPNPSDPKQAKSQEGQNNSPILQRGTEAAPLVVAVKTGEEDKQEAKDNRVQAKEAHVINRRQYYFNAVLAAVAVFQFGWTFLQLRTNRAQLRAYVSFNTDIFPSTLGSESKLPKTSVNTKNRLNDQQVKEFEAGRSALLLGVEIEYWDVFSRRHTTTEYAMFHIDGANGVMTIVPEASRIT